MSEVAQRQAEGKDWVLEIRGEVYDELATNIRGALSVAGAVREKLPTFHAERLEGCLNKALAAIGQIETTGRPEPETMVFDLDELIEEEGRDPIAVHNELLDRVHDSKVDRALEERAERRSS